MGLGTSRFSTGLAEPATVGLGWEAGETLQVRVKCGNTSSEMRLLAAPEMRISSAKVRL